MNGQSLAARVIARLTKWYRKRVEERRANRAVNLPAQRSLAALRVVLLVLRITWVIVRVANEVHHLW